MLYLVILLAAVFFASIAMCWNEGFWSNTISLVCVIVSGIAATIFGGPLGVFVAEKMDKTADDVIWYFVFAMTWTVFVLFILIFRTLTDQISRVRMKFVPQLDLAGGIVMALLVAVMFTSFASFTLLQIPIKAGEWSMKDASEWQKTAFQQTSSPFYTVAKKYTKANKIDCALVD